MNIAIGSDHAGFHYKEAIKEYLSRLGHSVEDFGTDSDQSVDYPVYIRPVAEAVAAGLFERGIVLGGSGNGEAIVANRVPGVRCSLVFSEDTARWASSHNNANMISIGARTIDQSLALRLVDLWLTTPFEGGRHARRIALIDPQSQIDSQNPGDSQVRIDLRHQADPPTEPGAQS